MVTVDQRLVGGCAIGVSVGEQDQVDIAQRVTRGGEVGRQGARAFLELAV